MERRDPWVEVPVRGIVRALVAVSILLAIASFLARWNGFMHEPAPHTLRALVIEELDVNEEHNLPTWWSGATLLVASLLAGAAAVEARRAGRAQAVRWTVLSGLIAYASLDEIAIIHERLNVPVTAVLGDGVRSIGNPWVIPGAVLVTIAAVSMLPLLQDLSPRVRRFLIGSVIVYFSGSLAMELVDGIFRQQHQAETLADVALNTVEELLEMTGEALLIGTLLVHLRERGVAVRVAGASATRGRDGDGPRPLRIAAGR